MKIGKKHDRKWKENKNERKIYKKEKSVNKNGKGGSIQDTVKEKQDSNK